MDSSQTGARLAKQIEAASKVLLTMLPIDPEGCTVVEAAQAKRILAQIPRFSLDMDAVAKLIGVIGVSSFSETNKSNMIKAVMRLKIVGGIVDGSIHDEFEHFPVFLPKSLEPFLNTQLFGSKFMEFMLKTGLISPSEETYRTMTLYLLVAVEGLEKTLGFTSESREAMIVTTKAWYRRILKKRVGSKERLILPATPEMLKESSPDLYAKLYESDEPSTTLLSLIPSASLEKLRGNTRMRRPKSQSYPSIPDSWSGGGGNMRMTMCNCAIAPAEHNRQTTPSVARWPPESNMLVCQHVSEDSVRKDLIRDFNRSQYSNQWHSNLVSENWRFENLS